MIDKGKVFAGVFDKIKDKIYELSGSESDGHKTPFGTDISKGNKPWSVEYELKSLILTWVTRQRSSPAKTMGV